MTPKKEDYLKGIYELGGESNQVSNKDIALSLNVAAGSVTEMIGKLVTDGLVNHTPYAGTTLTKEGLEVAENLTRRHRLWETFLVEKLGYKLAEVHDDAEVLEHATSEKLIDRLDAFLGYPESCPHGGTIPLKDGSHAKQMSTTFLAQVECGESVVVERFVDNYDLLTYLDELDLHLGDELQVIKKAPFEGPLTIEIKNRDKVLDIGYKAAHYIFVQ